MQLTGIGLFLMVLLAGCATRTPYSLDIARESKLYGKMTKAQAVTVVKDLASVSGEYADYRSFLLDEKGFSYTKTTKGTRTEWEGKKPVKKEYTHTLTRNVPWSAISKIQPLFQQHDVFGDQYIVRLDFKVMQVDHSTRREVRADLELMAKSYADLTDLTAALKVLAGS